MRMRENSHSCVSFIGKYVRMTFMEESFPSQESMQRGRMVWVCRDRTEVCYVIGQALEPACQGSEVTSASLQLSDCDK